MSETILPHYTHQDYTHWKGQWEIISGIPYAMSSFRIPVHQKIVSIISTQFRSSLKKYIVYEALPYHVVDDTILRPDIFIVANEITKKYCDFSPELVVEVLSPSTAHTDRYTKCAIYESQRIKYYITVNPDREEVKVNELENGEYELKQTGKDFLYDFIFQECTAQINFKEIYSPG